MGQNNQKDQKGPKMMGAVMLQNNQNNQKKLVPTHIPHNSESAFFLGHPVDGWIYTRTALSILQICIPILTLAAS